MVKRLLKLSLAYLLFLMVSGGLSASARSRCTVLYYHRVSRKDRIAFARQMDLLRERTRPIRLDRPEETDRPGRYSSVCFDDALDEIVENALPELAKRGIPATIFVPTGFLGKAPDWPGESDGSNRVISAEALRSLPADLVTIGSHTVTHPHLAELSPAEVRAELVGSKQQLEGILRRPVTLLAFPYGSYNDEVVRLSREAGYERVFTVEPLSACRSPEEFVAGRVPASPGDWRVEFELKLAGAYEWVPVVGRWKRKLGFGRSRA